MTKLQIKNANHGFTLISNTFIDKYMVTAGSSHLKTYLLFMRLSGDENAEITISGMADTLECSESDIIRSLRYWEKAGLFRLSFMGSGKEAELTGVEILPMEMEKVSASKSFAVKTEGEEEVADNPKELPLPAHKVNMTELKKNPEYGTLLFVAEQYIGKPLSVWESEIFAWMYDELKMKPALIEYLVESCVSNGHPSVRYMEKVAMDWHSKKITSVEQAKIYTPLHNKNLYTVMKAFGLSNRQPATAEKQFIDNWLGEMGFSLDLVVEACNRTIIQIHEPSFNYANSILERWKKAGVSSLEEAKAIDEEYQKNNSSNQAAAQANGRKQGSANGNSYYGNRKQAKPGARFHNFEQRNTDYDALLKQLDSKKQSQDAGE